MKDERNERQEEITNKNEGRNRNQNEKNKKINEQGMPTL